MYKFFHSSIFLIFLGLLTACASVAIQPEPPKLSVAGFKLTKLGLLEQKYRVQLRLTNPNPFSLPVERVNFQLYLNGKEFTNGHNQQPILIPPDGEEVFEIDTVSNLFEILDGWDDWKNALKNRRFTYRLVGSVRIEGDIAKKSFEHQGEIPLEVF